MVVMKNLVLNYALAFLPSSEIPDAFNQIKPSMPSNAQDVVQYFENNYVLGRVR
jgi:hypothetical protein